MARETIPVIAVLGVLTLGLSVWAILSVFGSEGGGTETAASSAVQEITGTGALGEEPRDAETGTGSAAEGFPESGVEDAGAEPGAISDAEPDGEVRTDPEGASGNERDTPEEPETPPGRAEELLARMSLREKVCQLLVVQPSLLTGVGTVTAAGETTRAALEKYPVGGLIYDATNFLTVDQTREMLSNVQEYSKIPLILTLDEEGGRVTRLMGTLGTTYVGPMLSYREQGASKAAENARTIGTDIASLGLWMDLAPVADVWSNASNTVIGNRAYSTDYEEASQLVAAAVGGFHDAGVACTLKHFPGHGDTSEDSHYGAAYVYKTLDELRAGELLPFRAGIDAGADAVMIGHLIVPDVSDEPALFSYELVTQVLRGEMGFSGVVMTDALQMQAMTDHYGASEIAVKAVCAGVDILLMPSSIEATVNALVSAVEQGTLTEERIDESVLRILWLKERYGLLE